MREEIGTALNRARVPLIRRTYDSRPDLCADAARGRHIFNELYGCGFGEAFASQGAGVRRWAEIEEMCRTGWTGKLPEALDLIERAVTMAETRIEMFEPAHAMTGADVDVAAAVAGLPDDMIEYPLTAVSNVGALITICCDVQHNEHASTAAITRRGMVVAALALTLDAAGHATDLWVSDEYSNGRCHVILRTRVKGPGDIIDPARIVYAFAHPSVQRGLGYCVVAGMPQPWSGIAAPDESPYGNVTPMTRDMPPGTLYFGPDFRTADNPNADTEVLQYLRQLGLLKNAGTHRR
jgi:hypothetical protein